MTSITNDGVTVTSAQDAGTTGSPFITPIAPQYAVALAPATQTDGGRGPVDVDYHVTVTNLGFATDSYTMSATVADRLHGQLPRLDLHDAGRDHAQRGAGDSTDVCVRVHVDRRHRDDQRRHRQGDLGRRTPSVSGTAQVKTIAVAVDTLLVDNDDNNPDVQGIYKTALTARRRAVHHVGPAG